MEFAVPPLGRETSGQISFEFLRIAEAAWKITTKDSFDLPPVAFRLRLLQGEISITKRGTRDGNDRRDF
jgi:hypothetical protein